jgi:hypothetical protein
MPSRTAPHHTSAPDDPYSGWVLRKYTTPAGHNGNMPHTWNLAAVEILPASQP